jgi:hypothetical protein
MRRIVARIAPPLAALVEALTAKTLKWSTQKRFDKRGRSWPDDPTSSPFTYKVKLLKAIIDKSMGKSKSSVVGCLRDRGNLWPGFVRPEFLFSNGRPTTQMMSFWKQHTP